MPIFSESLNRLKAFLSVNTVVKEEERLGGLKGQLFLKAWEGDKLVYSYESPNAIVDTASILIARLLKDSQEPTAGISFLAVGVGGAGWNLQNPPAPTVTQQTLESELFRKAIDAGNTSFVDPNTGSHTNVATKIVDFSTTFSEAEAVGPIVEMGLFGGDATVALNSGTMLNYRTFPVLNKTAAMTFSVIFRITC